MKRRHNLLATGSVGRWHVCGGRSSGTYLKTRRVARTLEVFDAPLRVFVSLWLLLGQVPAIGNTCLARSASVQSETLSVAVLSFQDESGAGATQESCWQLGGYLMKELSLVSNKNIMPRGVRMKMGAKITSETLAEFGQRMGVQVVVNTGLRAVNSEIADGKITTRVRLYADVFSVVTASTKRVEVEGIGNHKGAQPDTTIQWDSVDFRSREFNSTSLGLALSSAIRQLAKSIYQQIESGVSEEPAPDQPKTPADDTAPDKQPQGTVTPDPGQDDAGAAGEAQEAQADEELQQLIAQARECLNGLNVNKDKDKFDALIEALKGLTSALENKARLLEQGKVTETDRADQAIGAQEQALQDVVDQSQPQVQAGEPAPPDPAPGADPGPGGSKFDQVAKYVDLGFNVLDKILDLRARFRGITQDPTFGTSSPADPGQGTGEGAGAIPSEEPLETVSGSVTEEEALRGSLTGEEQGLALTMLQAQAGESARGPNTTDSRLDTWTESAASRVGSATTVALRRSPVVGAEVIEPDSGASTRTDNGGFFTLQVPARVTKLIVRKGGVKVAEVPINVVRGHATVVDIPLGSPGTGTTLQGARILPSSVAVNRDGHNTGTLSGEVQDANGKPAPRALIQLPGLAMARTDSQGRFTFLRVPAGAQRLTARAGNSESRPEQVLVRTNETAKTLIRLGPSSTMPKSGARLITPGAGTVLRGAILDSQNQPVAGAKVSAVSIGGAARSASVHAGAGGSYEFRDLTPGSYRVVVDKVGYSAAGQSISLQAGSVAPLNLRLKKDATSPFRPGVEEGLGRNLGEMRGQVRAKNGAPIPNAWVELKGTGMTSPTAPQRTGPRGEYVLKAFAGRYEIRVKARNFQEASRPVTVQARDSRAENFELTPSAGAGPGGGRALGAGTLAGRVTDTKTRTPVSGAIVSVAGKSATTGRTGDYSISNVPVGKQQVSVAKSGYANEGSTVEIRAGAPTSKSFELRAKTDGGSGGSSTIGQLRGRVTDDNTGRPISGAGVAIQGRSGTTDQAGNYIVTDLPAGRHQVTVTSRGYLTESETVEVRAGSHTSRNFELKPRGGGAGRVDTRSTGQLTGRVTDDKTGRPIPGAIVSISGQGSDTTDAGGNYTITRLPPGKYQLRVSRSGYLSETGNVEIRAGSSTVRRLDLTPAVSGTRNSNADNNRNSSTSVNRNSNLNKNRSSSTGVNRNSKSSKSPG